MANNYNSVAIVTGAACGIGYRIAEKLLVSGVPVIINDIDEMLLQSALEKLQDRKYQVEAVAGDSGSIDTINQLVDSAHQHFGIPTIAIANTGLSSFGSFLEFSPERLQQLLHVNIQGSFFLAQRAAQVMIENQIKGNLLFMSSITGYQYHPGLTAYGMTKAALRMLVQCLAVELSEHGITVHGIAPGATATERTMSDPDYEETWARLNPSGRTGTTTDIADTALFLLSEAGRQMTGQTLVVDGGWSLYSPAPD